MAEEAKEVAADFNEISAHEKCTKQLVQNVAVNVMFHLSQQKASQFIAKSATVREKDSNHFFYFLLFFYYTNIYIVRCAVIKQIKETFAIKK